MSPNEFGQREKVKYAAIGGRNGGEDPVDEGVYPFSKPAFRLSYLHRQSSGTNTISWSHHSTHEAAVKEAERLVSKGEAHERHISLHHYHDMGTKKDSADRTYDHYSGLQQIKAGLRSAPKTEKEALKSRQRPSREKRISPPSRN